MFEAIDAQRQRKRNAPCPNAIARMAMLDGEVNDVIPSNLLFFIQDRAPFGNADRRDAATCLLKRHAPKRNLIPVDTTRGWLEIDLDALTHNLSVVRERAEGAAILLVAKADAYGHGAIPVAHHALRAGVDAIGVSTAGEALELRRAGIRGRLVLLGVLFGEQAMPAIEHDVEIALPSIAIAEQLEEAGRRLARPVPVHLKIDTGMNRLGVRPEDALFVLRKIRSSPWLRLAGLMTHMAPSLGAVARAGKKQLLRFEQTLAAARAAGLLEGDDLWIHAANSATVLAGGAPRYDAVRVGAAAYGVSPDMKLDTRDLRPCMALRSKIAHLSEVEEGSEVGYGGSWSTRRPSRLAVVPLGYGDGIDWRLSNRGCVLVRGQRAPIVGRVSMDLTTIDVTLIPGVALGDEVTFFGRDGDRQLRLEEIASTIGSIPYELLCSIGRRVERVYGGGVSASHPSPARAITAP
ncbi:MAG: alanine racemase [Planctomycetota bacterium]|jgi:alanine racemase